MSCNILGGLLLQTFVPFINSFRTRCGIEEYYPICAQGIIETDFGEGNLQKTSREHAENQAPCTRLFSGLSFR